MVNGNLPPGWVWTNVNDIAHLIRGVSYKKGEASESPKEGYLPILRATNIQDEKLILDDKLVYAPKQRVKQEQELIPGDVVICISSGSKHLVGKAAQLLKDWEGSFGTFCIAARFIPDINHKYAGYFFGSPTYRREIQKKASGININNLRSEHISNISIPIPPLPEQERIVRRIESLFTQLEAGVAGLKRAQAALKRYKASVLKAACEGRLVAQEEGDEPADAMLRRMGKEPLAGDGLAELPEGWVWAKVSDISGKVTDGTHKTPTYVTDGIPFISVNNISNNGVINFRKSKYISPEEHIELYKRCNPEKGDVLLTKVGTVGLTAVVRTERTFSLFVNTALIKPVKEIIDSEYLAFTLRFGFITKAFDGQISGSTQKFIGTNKIGQLPIPLPPIREQVRITAEVERRLSVTQALEGAIEANLRRAGRLRQAILKRAFEGRLIKT